MQAEIFKIFTPDDLTLLGINESIKQADRGEFISYEDVKKGVSALLKK